MASGSGSGSAGCQNASQMPQTKATEEQVRGSEMVDVYVGPDRGRFTFHEKLVCDKLHRFHSLVENALLEHSEAVLEFPRHDKGSWTLLVAWLYSGEILPVNISSLSNSEYYKKLDTRMKLYVIAEELQLDEMLDPAMDAIYELCRAPQWDMTMLNFKVLDCPLLQSEISSPIRLFCVRWTKYGASFMLEHPLTKEKQHEATFESTFKEYVELEEGLVKDRKLTGTPPQRPTDAPVCDYHIHHEGVEEKLRKDNFQVPIVKSKTQTQDEEAGKGSGKAETSVEKGKFDSSKKDQNGDKNEGKTHSHYQKDDSSDEGDGSDDDIDSDEDYDLHEAFDRREGYGTWTGYSENSTGRKGW